MPSRRAPPASMAARTCACTSCIRLLREVAARDPGLVRDQHGQPAAVLIEPHGVDGVQGNMRKRDEWFT